MKLLPQTSDSPVIRTDFRDDAAWELVCDEIRRPSDEGFEAHVEFVDDPAYADLDVAQLLARVPAGYEHTFIIVVDRVAISSAEHAVLVVDLFDNRGAAFRALPAQVQAIENNLSIATMDFAEFATVADADGVFRGFGEP